jgi:hypothetical protein
MAVANKSMRIAKLDTHHTASLNTLSSTPQSLASHASALGLTTIEASHRLQLLVDEGLAVALKDSKGAPTGQYQLAS